LHYSEDFADIFVVILVVKLDCVGKFDEVFVANVIMDMTEQVQDEFLMESIALCYISAVVEVECIPVASRNSSDKEKNHKEGFHLER
jgi:hypothetical protein